MPNDEGNGAALSPASTARDDWKEAEEDGRCAENHYGWKRWCEAAMNEAAITHLAVCDAGDGTVWTRTSNVDGAAREAWNGSFPLFCCSGDAQNVIRKVDAETYWATDGHAGRRLAEAQTRLAFAASYHARLAEHSAFNHLPWDLLEKIQKWLQPQHRLLCPRGSSLHFHGESWVLLRFEAARSASSAATLIARRGQKGLTAFRTHRCLLVAVADEVEEAHTHNGTMYAAGCMADEMLRCGL